MSIWYNYHTQLWNMYDTTFPQKLLVRCPGKYGYGDRLLHPIDIICGLIFLLNHNFSTGVLNVDRINYYNYFDDNDDDDATSSEIKIYPMIKWFRFYGNIVLETLNEFEIELLKFEYVFYATAILKQEIESETESDGNFGKKNYKLNFHKNLISISKILMQWSKYCSIGLCLLLFPMSVILINTIFKNNSEHVIVIASIC